MVLNSWRFTCAFENSYFALRITLTLQRFITLPSALPVMIVCKISRRLDGKPKGSVSIWYYPTGLIRESCWYPRQFSWLVRSRYIYVYIYVCIVHSDIFTLYMASAFAPARASSGSGCELFEIKAKNGSEPENQLNGLFKKFKRFLIDKKIWKFIFSTLMLSFLEHEDWIRIESRYLTYLLKKFPSSLYLQSLQFYAYRFFMMALLFLTWPKR